MQLIVLVVIVISAMWIARNSLGRAVASRLVDQIARTVRVQSGSYELHDVVSQMLELALRSAVPSLTRTYLPSEFLFGIARQDADRWSALLSVIAQELAHLILARARELGYAVADRPRVGIAIKADVRPGRAMLLAAPISAGGVAKDPSDTVRVRAID